VPDPGSLKERNAATNAQDEGPAYWFSRAEEARVIAELMASQSGRLSMLKIAEIYTKIARRIEERRAEHQH